MMKQGDIKNEIDPIGVRAARVPEQVYPYTAGLVGGLLGGLAMIPVALAYGAISGTGPWYPVNMIAATVIRAWQNASISQLERFNFGGLVFGLLIHLIVASVLGLVFGILLPTLPRSPLFWAFIVGPVLWATALYVALPLINPVMAHYVDLASFAIANIVYSLVLGIWVERTPKISVK